MVKSKNASRENNTDTFGSKCLTRGVNVKHQWVTTPTCNNLAWRGRSCSGPCTWPARPKAPSDERRSSVGADWPHTRLQENTHVTKILEPVTRWQCWATSGQQPPAWSCTVSLTGSMQICCLSGIAHPSSWAGGTRPACIDLLERWTTRSGPEPEGINTLMGVNDRSDEDWKSESQNVQTWVVAVMDSTNVGTVEQLRLRRRPWGKRKDQRGWSAAAVGLQSHTIKRKSSTAGSSLQTHTQVTQTTAGCEKRLQVMVTHHLSGFCVPGYKIKAAG